MGMARQAPTTAVTGCLVCELEADSEEKGEDDLEERLGVTQELSVGRFVVEIDGDGTVLACQGCPRQYGDMHGCMGAPAFPRSDY